MYQMSVIWWILAASPTQSGKWVGLFMVMASLPSLLFMKSIGVWIDSFLSQKILVRSDLAAGVLLSVAAFLLSSGAFSIPLCFVFGFLAACLQAFIDPTLNKAVTEVVVPEDLDSGVALLTSTQSLANFSGAVFGAVLIDRIGIPGTVALAASGYLISSSCSAIARFRVVEKNAEADIGKTGWSILREFPFIKKLLVTFGLINFFATPTLVVLPIYTKNVLGESATVLGQLEASLWIGLLLGAFASRLVSDSLSRVKVGSVCLTLFGACLAVPGIVVSYPLYMAALFVAGLTLGINNVKFMSLFQAIVPQDVKGRFFALMQGIIGFTFPIGYFLFGFLTDITPVRLVCAIQGGGVVLVALYLLSLSRLEKA